MKCMNDTYRNIAISSYFFLFFYFSQCCAQVEEINDAYKDILEEMGEWEIDEEVDKKKYF